MVPPGYRQTIAYHPIATRTVWAAEKAGLNVKRRQTAITKRKKAAFLLFIRFTGEGKPAIWFCVTQDANSLFRVHHKVTWTVFLGIVYKV
jgi:hypothetical protein